LSYAFYTEIRDGKGKSSDYLNLVKQKVGFEQSAKSVESMIAYANSSFRWFTPKAFQEEEAEPLFQLFWDKLQEATAEEWGIIWSDAVINFAYTKRNAQRLLEHLDKKIGATAFNTSMRWRILALAASWDLPGTRSLLEAEAKKDPSDKGEKSVLKAKAAFPDQKVKAEEWARYVNKDLDETVSMKSLAASMGGFRLSKNESLLEPYDSKYFDVVVQYYRTRNVHLASAFGDALFPFKPEDPSIADRTIKIIETLDKKKDVALRKLLREKLDDLKRSAQAFKIYLSSPPTSAITTTAPSTAVPTAVASSATTSTSTTGTKSPDEEEDEEGDEEDETEDRRD